MKFPKARKFFGGMRKRIYGIFGRKIGSTASKSIEPNIKQPIGHHCRLPMELECESTTDITMDLPRPHHRKLPAELNREIFLCFSPATQRKFICELGWNFYAIFRHRLLTKTKRVCYPDQNAWNGTTTHAIVSRDGLNARNTYRTTCIYAEKGFAIKRKLSRADSFPGTIIYYYEVKLSSSYCCRIGLSNGTTSEGIWLGEYPNSYAISNVTGLLKWCRIAGSVHVFQLPTDDAIKPVPKENGTNVYGCGLVMDPNDKLAIFFTLNGILMCRQISISISPSAVDQQQQHLFPAISLFYAPYSIEANFGNDKNKPFEYDINKCLGMGLDC